MLVLFAGGALTSFQAQAQELDVDDDRQVLEEMNNNTDDYFTGFTPLSPSVWNAYNNKKIRVQSELQTYLFREAYLVEADKRMFSREGRMFMVPLDDLATTQSRILSPLQKEDEEKVRRDYAESVVSIVASKGLPEYMLQLLGFQKLREGIKKIEKAVSLDVSLSKEAKEGEEKKKDLRPWRFRGVFLPYQRSYAMGFTDSVWTLDVQGGFATAKGSKLFANLSARWGRYLQSNIYQFLTRRAVTSFSIFLKDDLSFTLSLMKDFGDPNVRDKGFSEAAGVSYIF